MSDYPRFAAFAATVGSPWRLDLGEKTLDLELASADETPYPEPGREQFSLMFVGPADPVLPQATYPLEHPSLGAMQVFLVPVGRDDSGTRYQAVFDREAEE